MNDFRWVAVAAALTATLLLAAVLVGCGGDDQPGGPDGGTRVEVEGGAYTRIDAEQLKGILEGEPTVALVNVHIPYDGEIPRTSASVPFNEMESFADAVAVSRDARVVVYCRSGNMSAQAAADLVRLGYTNVFDLAGGMAAWQEAGYPLTRAGG